MCRPFTTKLPLRTAKTRNREAEPLGDLGLNLPSRGRISRNLELSKL
jgi:hypothetical protein